MSLQTKTRIFIPIVVLANVAGNYSLSRGMQQVGETVSASPLPYLRALLNPWVILGVALLAVWLLSQLSLLSWADLSYVLPVTATAYALSGLAGWLLLGEHVAISHWVGIALITIGAIFVGRTAARTTPPEKIVHTEL